VHEVCGRPVLECRTIRDEADGPWVHHGRSVFLGALLEVRVAISDGPHPPHEQLFLCLTCFIDLRVFLSGFL
jgi:hypothetical protein